MLPVLGFVSAALGVKPFNCSSNSPIQVLSKDGGKTFDVKALEIATGTYEQLYQFPLDYIPGLKNVNGAAINPKDGKPYCTISYNGYNSYIARFDSSTVEFIAKLSQGGTSSYNTAAFTELGDYVLPKGGTTKMYVFKSADILGATAFANVSAQLADWGGHTPLSLSNKVAGSDIATFKGDFEGTGSEQQYAMDLHTKTQGRVTLYNLDTGNNWYLDASATDSSDFVSATTQGWGAAWTYGNEIYFGHNGGLGVFKVFQNSIDIGEGKVSVIRVGSSTATGFNDGMNCLLTESPWTNPPTPAPTPGSCWSRVANKYVSGFSENDPAYDVAGAKAKCLDQNGGSVTGVCKAITCVGDGATPCTLRSGTLMDSIGNNPVSYIPHDCTGMPTRTPTPKPTKAPTQGEGGGEGAPTQIPTKAPTGTPTKAPTTSPTLAPTKAPTCKPIDCKGVYIAATRTCIVCAAGEVFEISSKSCKPKECETCVVECATGIYDAQRGVCIECKDDEAYHAATGKCIEICDNDDDDDEGENYAA